MTTCRTGDTSTLWPVRGRCPPAPSTFTTTRRCVLLASHPRSTGEETDTGQAARPRPRPQPRSRRREEAASGPRPVAPGLLHCRPARASLSPSPSRPADRGGVRALLLPDQEERELQEPGEAELPAPRQEPGERPPGCSQHARWQAPSRRVPLAADWDPLAGGGRPSPAARNRAGRGAIWFPAWKVLELGLVAQGPRGSMAGVVWLRGQRTGPQTAGSGVRFGARARASAAGGIPGLVGARLEAAGRRFSPGCSLCLSSSLPLSLKHPWEPTNRKARSGWVPRLLWGPACERTVLETC